MFGLRKKPQVKLQPKPPTDYIPSPDWRRSPELTSATKRLFLTTEMLGILELLRKETPKQIMQLPLNASEGEQLRLGSLEDGYYICLNKLLSLQTLAEDAQDVEATFEER